MVLIGVDPHKASHTAVVVDDDEHELARRPAVSAISWPNSSSHRLENWPTRKASSADCSLGVRVARRCRRRGGAQVVVVLVVAVVVVVVLVVVATVVSADERPQSKSEPS